MSGRRAAEGIFIYSRDGAGVSKTEPSHLPEIFSLSLIDRTLIAPTWQLTNTLRYYVNFVNYLLDANGILGIKRTKAVDGGLSA